MTREWSAANLMPSSVIWTWTLLVKFMHRSSWYRGLVEFATARKSGWGAGVLGWASSGAMMSRDAPAEKYGGKEAEMVVTQTKTKKPQDGRTFKMLLIYTAMPTRYVTFAILFFWRGKGIF